MSDCKIVHLHIRLVSPGVLPNTIVDPNFSGLSDFAEEQVFNFVDRCELNPEGFPGHTDDQFPKFVDEHCRQCDIIRKQQVVRHHCWWSGDITKFEWHQKVLTCEFCGVYNITRTDKRNKSLIDHGTKGLLKSVKIDKKDWDHRWKARDPKYTEPATGKGIGIETRSEFCQSCKRQIRRFMENTLACDLTLSIQKQT
jgi:hypothetical protein